MRISLFLTLAVMWFFSILPHSLLAGNTYYVAPHGANAGAGTVNSPLRSLSHAVRLARPGDTIILRGGIYNMGEVLIDRKKGIAGRPGQYITIKAFDGEEPILRGRRRLIIHSGYIRIEGLHFIMPWRCEAFGREIQLVNNKFTGPQPKFGAIETGGVDILIEGNFIEYNNAGGNTQDHGIYVHKGKRITLRNNVILSSKGYGIHLYDEHKSANPQVWAAHPFVMKDYLIEGNFVASSQLRSGMVIGKGRGGNFITLENITIRNNVFATNKEFGLLLREGRNITVVNNTFYSNHLAAILIRYPGKGLEPVSNVTIKNNIFASVGRGHVGDTSEGNNIKLENNLYDSDPRMKGDIQDSNPIIGEPLFVDVNDHDFRLQEGSPAIDAGEDVGLPYSGSAPDLGAFEFGNSSDGRTPHIPDAPAPEMSTPKDTRQETDTVPEVKTIPTEEVTFQAFEVGYSVILHWKMEKKDNLLGFKVQRSPDGKDFEDIGQIRAHGANSDLESYQYVDEQVRAGRYFYRLKMVMQDRSFGYSAKIKVELGHQNE